MLRPRGRGTLAFAFSMFAACRSHPREEPVAPTILDASRDVARDVQHTDSLLDAERDGAIDSARLQAFCRAKADANERLYARATRHANCPNETMLHVHAALARCTMTSRGAWAVTLRDLRVVETDAGVPSCEGNWELVFSNGAEDDARATGPEATFAWRQDARGGSVPGALQSADLDGDGVPEGLVRTHSVGLVSSDSGWSILTVHAAQVVTFSPAADLLVTDVEDVDHDGRLDLVTPGPYVARSDDGSQITGPPLLAHTLGDGTFAFDDNLARSFARRQCPRHPRDVIVRRTAPDAGSMVPVDDASALDLDVGATGRRVVCSRIAGATVREVLDQLATVCTAYASHDRDAGVAAPGTCPAFLRAWASTTPPVSFSPR